MNKFSADVFCFFMGLYVFNGIQASYAGFFDTEKKEACPARTNKTLRPADTPRKEGNYIPSEI
ncbi:hypothetical protein [Pedobacter borealis]|uniref:hypothetical protein n=1 Tax=Pedobacter borealis TaxID=475254 RepID=UPI0012F9E6BA|nr:hypothetical protein [Pedobacter borealis]